MDSFRRKPPRPSPQSFGSNDKEMAVIDVGKTEVPAIKDYDNYDEVVASDLSAINSLGGALVAGWGGVTNIYEINMLMKTTMEFMKFRRNMLGLPTDFAEHKEFGANRILSAAPVVRSR